MDSPSTSARACPSCSAPAEAQQRWCLECGGELPGARHPGLRPAVGIATTLVVLVGAASAGGYTLLQEGKKAPPPATTVAQTAPAPAPETLPPATQDSLPGGITPPPSSPSLSPPSTPTPSAGGSAVVPPVDPGTSGGGTSGSSGTSGAVAPAPEGPASTTPPPEPQLALTDIALGAAVVVYAPYAPDTADLGDPSRAVDGSTRTAWKAPAGADPSASPQLGLYVDLAGKETVRRVVIRTPTLGMNVEVYGAESGPPATITEPGWDHLVDRAGIAGETTIKLPAHPYRYLLVWITGAPPDGSRPAISELSLLSLQPE